ncbi:hypothetical protein BD410DRAFT_788153 [Rickenella mellea]|uniref:SMODS and SLOG-associating 2TM effector domain-containing protein n=1 Tax=Rickenella mellea TaxID=50990 RepID=A0A4Y7Q575_9AGAM|nr:hypothetical protein BD410DRAFT_788153 [Rickenella mellea]
MDPQSNQPQAQNVLRSDSRGGVANVPVLGVQSSTSAPPVVPLRRGASTSTSIEKLPFDEKHSSSVTAQGASEDSQPALPQDQRNSSGNSTKPRKTVEKRLTATIEAAKVEQKKFSRNAFRYGLARDIALGLQILSSALITALSAVGGDRKTQISTAVLGAIATMVASYLARIRGTGEPHLSYSRSKNLQSFVRQCESFIEDHGDETDQLCDAKIDEFRKHFEDLLGTGPDERKLVPTKPGDNPPSQPPVRAPEIV